MVESERPTMTEIRNMELKEVTDPSVFFLADITERKGNLPMLKTAESLSEVIRNDKHPFRQVDNRPAKPQKHRYERRKVREILRMKDWDDLPES